MSIHYKHLTQQEREAIASTKTFEELGRLAASIVKRHGGPFHAISGPISTGGVGNREGNIRVFQAAIERLAKTEKLLVFSQIPFEDKIKEFTGAWRKLNSNADYPWPILHIFYEELFSSGGFHTLHFLHNYTSSVGAKWEHDNCPRWRIRRRFLSKKFSEELLLQSV